MNIISSTIHPVLNLLIYFLSEKVSWLRFFCWIQSGFRFSFSIRNEWKKNRLFGSKNCSWILLFFFFTRFCLLMSYMKREPCFKNLVYTFRFYALMTLSGGIFWRVFDHSDCAKLETISCRKSIRHWIALFAFHTVNRRSFNSRSNGIERKGREDFGVCHYHRTRFVIIKWTLILYFLCLK